MTPPSLGTFKLILAGDGNVGKTRFVRSQGGNYYRQFDNEEKATITKNTNYGPITFDILETLDSANLSANKDATCAIIMFDVTSRPSYDKVEKWHEDITKVCGEISTIILGNKVDLNEDTWQITSPEIQIMHSHPVSYFHFSVKSGYNYEKPLQLLAQKLTGYSDLVITS